MEVPYVWHVAGVKPGPIVAVLGGTHGDEMAGIHVVRRLLKQFAVLQHPAGISRSDWVLGDLYLGFGNPEAIIRRTRGASNVIDLNRCFWPDPLQVAASAGEPMDLTRARQLAPLFAQLDLLVDLHGTSLPSEPFVCLGDVSPMRLDLIGLIPARYVVTDPDNVLARDEGKDQLPTTDQYVNGRGGIAFAYETGQEDDLTAVDSVFQTVLRILVQFDVLDPRFLEERRIDLGQHIRLEQKVFRLAEAVPAEEDSFEYVSGMDKSWVTVEAGQLIGTYPSGAPVVAPRDGTLVLQKSPAKVKKGKTLYYLALER